MQIVQNCLIIISDSVPVKKNPNISDYFSSVWYADPAGDDRYFPQFHRQAETRPGVFRQVQVLMVP
jgi:hypothetical protein